MIKDEFGNARFAGVYRAIVVDNKDPKGLNRLRLQIPQLLGEEVTGWCWGIFPNTAIIIPNVNDGVWVMFEGGDPSYPTWLGSFNQGKLYAKYGAFQYTGFQTATTTTAQAFPWDTTDFSSDVYTSNTSRVYFPPAGPYNIHWSGQFENSSKDLEDIDVWLRINGTDVPGSTGLISIPAGKKDTPSHMIIGWNYFLQFTAGQYLEIMWAASNTTVTLQSYAAGTTPTTPTTAALILTANLVS